MWKQIEGFEWWWEKEAREKREREDAARENARLEAERIQKEQEQEQARIQREFNDLFNNNPREFIQRYQNFPLLGGKVEDARRRVAAEDAAEAARIAAIEEAARIAAIEAEKQRLAKEKADRESSEDWLTTEIARLNKQLDDANTILSTENSHITTTTSEITSQNLELAKLKALFEIEKNKGSPYEQGTAEIKTLIGLIQQCKDKTKKYQDSYDRSVINIQESTWNLQNITEKYNSILKNNLNDILLLNKETIKTLSETIVKLKKTITELSETIKGDELSMSILNQDIITLNNTISILIIIDYSNKVYNSKNTLNLTEKVDTSLNYFFSDLKTKNINPELRYRKIKYREIEKQKLNNFNKLLDVLFYCFYFSFILIMICTGNTKREYFLIYAFIGLIPFLFPIIIKITKNMNVFDINILNEKNAFIENDTQRVNAFNI